MHVKLSSFGRRPKSHDFEVDSDFKIKANTLHISSSCRGPVDKLLFDKELRGKQDNLWKQSCFELFYFQDKRINSYEEWNFSPSNAHQNYSFSDYRTRSDNNDKAGPNFGLSWQMNDNRWDFSLELDFGESKAPELLNICWVLKTSEGISYWAANHPDESPDFHQKRSFLEL